MDLKEEIKIELKKTKRDGGSVTIPGLCQKLGVSDDFILSSIIAELENSGEVEFVDFKTVYREDGGAIHLARYTGSAT